jgi:hypothetical protein
MPRISSFSFCCWVMSKSSWRKSEATMLCMIKEVQTESVQLSWKPSP